MKKYVESVAASKKIKTLVLLLMFIGVCQALSCKKYLDEKPNKNMIVPHALTDLQALLDNNKKMNTFGTPSFGEASTNDYFISAKSYYEVGVHAQKVYTWQVKDYGYRFGRDWAYSYGAIYYANYCLDQLSGIDKTEKNKATWNNVKGSALFFRAYYFLGLVWEYAKAYDPNTAKDDLGIVLRLTSDFNIKSKRASVQDSYNRIIKDAKEAVTYLPDLPEHVMRPSHCAAYGLLARAYLSMRQYDSAYKYANLSLQLNNNLLDYNDKSKVDILSKVPFKPFNEEIIFFTNESVNNPTVNPFNAMIDTILYSSYNANDLRKTVFFYQRDGHPVFKGNYNAINQYSNFFSGIATDEMYLTRAECEVRLGKIDDAMHVLNMLLSKRWKIGTFTPLTASSQHEALSIILKERRKELLMRGLHWIDIKRLNKEGANIILKRIMKGKIYTLMPGDNYCALPLPSDILQLTGMPQNPE